MERETNWGRQFGLPYSAMQPTYIAGAKGGEFFLGVTILEGDSFCVDDSLGFGASHGNEGSQYFLDSMHQEGL